MKLIPFSLLQSCLSPFLSLFPRLHQELEDFAEFMKPRPEEVALREAVVQRVRDIVTAKWPEARVCRHKHFKDTSRLKAVLDTRG